MEHLNRVELIGRIGMVNTTEVGNLTHYRFSLGVDTPHGDVVETTWFNCSHWGSGEKIIPGRDIHIEGRIACQLYTDVDGAQRAFYEVKVSSIY